MSHYRGWDITNRGRYMDLHCQEQDQEHRHVHSQHWTQRIPQVARWHRNQPDAQKPMWHRLVSIARKSTLDVTQLVRVDDVYLLEKP